MNEVFKVTFSFIKKEVNMGYLANFLVYVFAMVGVIVAALLIFKNATTVGGGKSSKYLKLIDTMSLGPRKTLYIVSTGREKFLLAGDVDKTCLISKLEGTKVNIESEPVFEDFRTTMENLPKKNYTDRSDIGIKSSILNKNTEKTYGSVMRNLAEKIK